MVEYFDDEAILFVADYDLLLTVNRAAAELFEAAAERFGAESFSRSDGLRFLTGHYDLPAGQAARQRDALLGFGLRHNLVTRERIH